MYSQWKLCAQLFYWVLRMFCYVHDREVGRDWPFSWLLSGLNFDGIDVQYASCRVHHYHSQVPQQILAPWIKYINPLTPFPHRLALAVSLVFWLAVKPNWSKTLVVERMYLTNLEIPPLARWCYPAYVCALSKGVSTLRTALLSARWHLESGKWSGFFAVVRPVCVGCIFRGLDGDMLISLTVGSFCCFHDGLRVWKNRLAMDRRLSCSYYLLLVVLVPSNRMLNVGIVIWRVLRSIIRDGAA